ncbi:Hypothetical predicted protein [Lecanosticta acicola]|uniref:Sialidase domain-containing protein n=1 Tax=Lecanosticta acicola TaxID=111012 RepID=A0AAI8YSM6_9PEZI|nr:Hypothetical predicted protein [Lecanosticta acicola]
MQLSRETPSGPRLATSPSYPPRRPAKTLSFPPAGTVRTTRNFVLMLVLLALLLNTLATGPQLRGITFVSFFSFTGRQGSVPTIQEGPATIDTNGVYIRAARLNDGSLIAGYTQTTPTHKILLTSRSVDNGQTWTPHGEVFRADRTTHDCDNAFPMQLANGRILFAWRNHQKNENGRYTYFRISVCFSDDNGVTFKYLSAVDERHMQGINGLWEPYLRIDRSGNVQCYYSAENGPPDQDGIMRISQDGGQTWGDRILVSGHGVASRDGMIGCAPTDDGSNLICVFESTEVGHFTVSAVFSHDDGQTWGERRQIYTPRNGTGCDGKPIVAGAPQISNMQGTLVLSFMTNEDHDDCHGYDGGDMKVITSTDGGHTWSKSYIVGPAPAHWGGIFRLDRRHFLALYSRDGHGALGQKVLLS